MSDLADEVLAKRFTGTRFRAGYAVDEVDGFLEGLRTRHPATDSRPTGGRPDSSTVPEPTLPTSAGGLRGWLFGRR